MLGSYFQHSTHQEQIKNINGKNSNQESRAAGAPAPRAAKIGRQAAVLIVTR
jgi:hypothetical protein